MLTFLTVLVTVVILVVAMLEYREFKRVIGRVLRSPNPNIGYVRNKKVHVPWPLNTGVTLDVTLESTSKYAVVGFEDLPNGFFKSLGIDPTTIDKDDLYELLLRNTQGKCLSLNIDNSESNVLLYPGEYSFDYGNSVKADEACVAALESNGFNLTSDSVNISIVDKGEVLRVKHDGNLLSNMYNLFKSYKFLLKLG